jgi:hypothetical protein
VAATALTDTLLEKNDRPLLIELVEFSAIGR